MSITVTSFTLKYSAFIFKTLFYSFSIGYLKRKLCTSLVLCSKFLIVLSLIFAISLYCVKSFENRSKHESLILGPEKYVTAITGKLHPRQKAKIYWTHTVTSSLQLHSTFNFFQSCTFLWNTVKPALTVTS